MSRSNAEQWDVEKLGVSCREQAWEIRYVYSLLIKELCEKHGYESCYYTKNVSPYEACTYKRSENLCRTHLLNKRLITPSNQSVKEVALQVAAQYAVEPTFEIKYTKGEYSWNKEPIHSPEDAYHDLTRLKKRELFYVYLNQKLYDIHVYSVTKKITPSRYSSATERIETTLDIFPRDMVKGLIDALCHEKINYFLNERIQLKARIFFDLELQSTKSAEEPWKGITQYEKDTPITTEEFERRMRLATDAVSFYQRACMEFEKKRDRLATGKTVNVDHEVYKKVLEYFRINAPLYINEEEDKELFHFAKLIMEGADNKRIAFEWMNPAHK